MSEPLDPHFYERADAFIHLANGQIADIGRGKVSASFMYAAARFHAWVGYCKFVNADEMRQGRQETIAYFVKQYTAMLEENLDDYLEHFDRYMQNPTP